MQLLVRRFEDQFQRNHLQHVFVEELKVKIQQLRECFTENNLPVPTAKVAAAWHNLPNGTIDDVLPMSMRTDVVLLPRAPPPTPMGFDFGMDNATSPFNDSYAPDDGWVLVDTPRPTSELAAPWSSTVRNASEFIALWGTKINPCSDIYNAEEDQIPFTDRDSPSSSSDPESPSSGNQLPLEPVGFDALVDQWFLEYRAQGKVAFTTSLIGFGTRLPETASLAASIARAIIRRVSKISYTEGKDLENEVRFTALSSFQTYWQLDDLLERVPPNERYSSDIASLLGSLFDAKICTPRDVHICLHILLQRGRRFDRLCAMLALLIQANDKLCKTRHLATLMHFRQRITIIDVETGDYFWATTPQERMVLNNILATIEQWMASQTLKRDRTRASSPGNSTTMRKRAVGPRLRNDPGVVPFAQ